MCLQLLGHQILLGNGHFFQQRIAGKTKNLKSQLAKLELANALIIDGAAPEEAFVKAARNIPNIDVLPIQGINVVDILRRRKLVLTKAAIEALEERFADAKVKAPAEAGE